jgi:hypothetical protein
MRFYYRLEQKNVNFGNVNFGEFCRFSANLLPRLSNHESERSQFMKLSADLLDDLNGVRLREEELCEVINATIEAYAKGESHKLTGVINAMQFFNNTPDKAKAIIFRLQALGLMIQNDELKDWIRTDGTSVVPMIIQKALARISHQVS